MTVICISKILKKVKIIVIKNYWTELMTHRSHIKGLSD